MWPRNKRSSEAGFLTLIELLVVLVIILGFFWVFTGGGGRSTLPTRPGGPTTTPGRAIEQAKNVECKTNLGQIRQAIQIYKMTSDDRPPASLDDLRLPSESTHCPVTKQPYIYDPQTGQVRCSVPGHERY